jgi:predicted phage tail protein
MNKKKIIGAGGGGGGGKGGGGGGGGRVAQEAPDTLRSIAYAKVLDLVAEGEIEGLADGLKSVYFNNTPLQNDNGTFNFSGASVVSTRGTQDQSYIEGFPAVENELGVNTQVEFATPMLMLLE